MGIVEKPRQKKPMISMVLGLGKSADKFQFFGIVGGFRTNYDTVATNERIGGRYYVRKTNNKGKDDKVR